MRKICLVLGVLLTPLPATAQHSWSLPAIGLPPPPSTPAVKSEWRQRTPWDHMQPPAWERGELPAWERKHPDKPRRERHDNAYRGYANVVYIPYAVAYEPPPPQVIVVEQPPVTRIVHVEVPAPESPSEESPRIADPPYVPTGDRTVYVIPGCYVGNVSPVNLKLPENCDITKLTTYVP